MIQSRDKKQVLVGDTPALLSLEMGSILDHSCDLFSYMIPNVVHSELKDISVFNDDHSAASKRILGYIEDDQIRIVNIKNETTVDEMVNDFSTIDRGEAESLVLAQENDIDILITDDLRSLGALKKLSKGVRIHLSVYVISRIVLSGDIQKRDAFRALNRIASVRSWENAAIYRKAIEYIREI